MFFKERGFLIYQEGMMNPRDLLVEGEHGDSRRSDSGLFCLIFLFLPFELFDEN